MCYVNLCLLSLTKGEFTPPWIFAAPLENTLLRLPGCLSRNGIWALVWCTETTFILEVLSCELPNCCNWLDAWLSLLCLAALATWNQPWPYKQQRCTLVISSKIWTGSWASNQVLKTCNVATSNHVTSLVLITWSWACDSSTPEYQASLHIPGRGKIMCTIICMMQKFVLLLFSAGRRLLCTFNASWRVSSMKRQISLYLLACFLLLPHTSCALVDFTTCTWSLSYLPELGTSFH